jgi:site-specific DNA-methyltransferase (adenine-specific)
MKTFTKDGQTIIFGDTIKALKSQIDDNSIDLIFADPPYNIGKVFNGRKEKRSDGKYISWCKKWLGLCIKKLKKTGSLYVMTATQYMPYFDLYLRDKIHTMSRIVWFYDSSGVQAKKYFGSLYEPILFCAKDKKSYTFNSNEIMVEAKTGAKRKLIDYRKKPPQIYNSKKVPGNVWEFPRVRYRMPEYEKHPTQKPVALLERIIKASSNKGDLVLDPFSGTFTTSFVAQKLKRRSIGIELDEEYVKIGLRRLNIKKQYNGEGLKRELKSYEIKNSNQLSLA